MTIRDLVAAVATVAVVGGTLRATSPAAPPEAWRAGLDVSVEGATSLHGGRQSGRTLHTLALAHLAWNPPAAKDRFIQFNGFASALGLAGQGPTGRFVGDFLSASNIEGFESLRVYTWWLEAHAGDWHLRGGLLLADEEFAGTAVGGNFLNSTFGWPTFISASTINTGPAFFATAAGLRLKRDFGPHAYLQAGVYDGDTFDSPAGDAAVNRDGLHLHLGGAQGWFSIVEAGGSPDASVTRLKLGAWFHSAAFADVFADTTGHSFALTGAAPHRHDGNRGAYATIERTLAGKPGEPGGIEVHLRGGTTPGDRNPLRWGVDTGIAFTGPLPSRPADVLALGFAQTRFSPLFAASARDANPVAPAPDFEEVVELGYSLACTDRCKLKPSLQHIRHPGGSAAFRDALLLLVRFDASF